MTSLNRAGLQVLLYWLAVAFLIASAVPRVWATEVRLSEIDRNLGELAPYIQNYPPQFADVDQRKEIEERLRVLLRLLDKLNDQNPNEPQLLLRKGMAYGMAHNLDQPRAAETAIAAFDRAVSLTPEDRYLLYRYGGFLSGTTLFSRAVPILQQSVSLGEPRAHYPLGFDYFKLGDPKKAVEELRAYLEFDPTDESAKKAIQQMESGKLKVKMVQP
jgi:tetratricopeptide (TPR) repeat protein